MTECFLEHYDEVQACVKKTKHTLLSSSPAKEAKDHVWLKGYIFVAPICLSVYRFIGLSVYRFIGLSVYRVGGVYWLSLQDPGFAKHANLRQVIQELQS